jgi:hypothetical protein
VSAVERDTALQFRNRNSAFTAARPAATSRASIVLCLVDRDHRGGRWGRYARLRRVRLRLEVHLQCNVRDCQAVLVQSESGRDLGLVCGVLNDIEAGSRKL